MRYFLNGNKSPSSALRLRAVGTTVLRVALGSQVRALPLLQEQIFKWVASLLQPLTRARH